MTFPVARSVRDVWGRSAISPVALVLMWGGNLALGLVLILGDNRRASGPTFSSVTNAGGPDIVGSGFIVIGVLLALAPLFSRRVLAAACLAATAGHLLFAIGFAVAIANEPVADDPTDVLVPFTGIVAYGWFIAGMHFVNAVLYARPRATSPPSQVNRKDPGA